MDCTKCLHGHVCGAPQVGVLDSMCNQFLDKSKVLIIPSDLDMKEVADSFISQVDKDDPNSKYYSHQVQTHIEYNVARYCLDLAEAEHFLNSIKLNEGPHYLMP